MRFIFASGMIAAEHVVALRAEIVAVGAAQVAHGRGVERGDHRIEPGRVGQLRLAAFFRYDQKSFCMGKAIKGEDIEGAAPCP